MNELSLNLLDIVENSLTAGASRIGITIAEDHDADTLSITVTDDGRGMAPDMLARVESPFSTTRTTRKVGLGIPFFKYAAESTGGHFVIASELGKGTRVCATFGLAHLDRMPMGDLAGSLLAMVMIGPWACFDFSYSVNQEVFRLNTDDIKAELGGVLDISAPEVAQWLREYVAENVAVLGARA